MSLLNRVSGIYTTIEELSIDGDTKSQLLAEVDLLHSDVWTMDQEYDAMFRSWQKHVNPCVAQDSMDYALKDIDMPNEVKQYILDKTKEITTKLQ